MPDWPVVLGLAFLGAGVGTIGTLIGAGGAFVLMPILLMLYPNASPDTLASITLAVVFFNTASGTAAYARMRRVDWKAGGLFCLGIVPGAVAGAFTTRYLHRGAFDAIIGCIMVGTSVYIFIRRSRGNGDEEAPPKERGVCMVMSHLIDSSGTVHDYCYDYRLGIGLSFLASFLSGLVGLGGGIMHVPLLTEVLGFPVHVATATSHFVLSVMSFAATGVHIFTGAFAHGVHRALALSVGVVVGAQLGAKLSNKLHGTAIVRVLALALGIVGLRVIWGAITGVR